MTWFRLESFQRCQPDAGVLRLMTLTFTLSIFLSDIMRAADRTTLFVPVADLVTAALPDNAVFADQAFGNAKVEGWNAYVQLWKAHHNDPTNPILRRYLGLPLQGNTQIKHRPGRSAPRWLAWRGGSYAQFDTPHFVIYSRADDETSRAVIEDLERCYWVWTQMFFPLWEAHPQIARTFDELTPDQSIPEFLQGRSDRLGLGAKLRVVLFRDATEYRKTIDIPGVERSTGFYSDERQTTFLYGDKSGDKSGHVATRRHELVHQLFREATDSGLRRQMPGEDSDFWLIEGIAGYFESLHVGTGYATVGGWDSPRLQFARYRFFAGGDRLPMAELRKDGRLAAQQRPDIARWYAHAIAQTHRLLDGGDCGKRQWVYQQLAEQYRIGTTFEVDDNDPGDANSVLEFLSVNDDHLAANRAERKLTHLCLAGCSITPAGLAQITPSDQLSRLTLTGRSINVESVVRLIPNSKSIRQLSLEGTAIDSRISTFLNSAVNLAELDLSSTAADDSVVDAIGNATNLSTLWMTGTKVTDHSISVISEMPRLENIDLQRTGVTAAGIERLVKDRPKLNVNPLEIQEP